MKCSLKIGERAKIVSLLASYCVVLIHTVRHPWRLDVAIMTQWAVPWFLFLSGVFFRVALDKYDMVHIIKDRSKKLLWPYIIFGLFGYIVTAPPPPEVNDSINNIFGLMSASPAYNQPLWFLKSLYICSIVYLGCFMLFGKLQSSIIKNFLCVGFYLGLVSALVIYTDVLSMPASPFYFIIGVCCSQVFLKRDTIPNIDVAIYVALGLIVGSCVIRYVWDPSCIMFSAYSGQMRVVRNITNVTMICAVWILSGVLPAKPWTVKLLNMAPASLLIYLCHFPLLQILKRFSCLDRVYSSTVGSCIVSLVMTLAIMYVWRLLRRYAPRCLAIVQGGRA